MLNPPPSRNTFSDVISICPLSEKERSIITRYVGRHHEDGRIKHARKKGGILPKISEIFGCEREKTDLRDTHHESFFDKGENCLHGDIGIITRCCDIKNCKGSHLIDNGLGGSRYRLACPGAKSLGAIRRGRKGGAQ